MAQVIGPVNRLEVLSDDERRTIREYNGSNYSIQHFVVKASLPLGKHFHREKDEHFFIQKGGGTYQWCPVDESGTMLGNVQVSVVTAGVEVLVPALTAHMFVLEAGTEMVCFSTARFNSEDMPRVGFFD
jgi:mannose-6-phosphate isomerase-like protein (cupin superfamily)